MWLTLYDTVCISEASLYIEGFMLLSSITINAIVQQYAHNRVRRANLEEIRAGTRFPQAN